MHALYSQLVYTLSRPSYVMLLNLQNSKSFCKLQLLMGQT